MHGTRSASSRQPPAPDAVMKERDPKRSAEPDPDPTAALGGADSANSLKRRKALSEMHQVGATNGGVVQTAPAALMLQREETIPKREETNPKDAERVRDAKDMILVTRILSAVIGDPIVAQYIEGMHASPTAADIQKIFDETVQIEKGFLPEMHAFYNYFVSKATIKFLKERESYPTDNRAYQTACEAVVIRAVRIALAKIFIDAQAGISQPFVSAKVRYCREKFAQFDRLLTAVVSKLPQDENRPEVIKNLQTVLSSHNEEGNKEAKASFLAAFGREEARLKSAVEGLYVFLDEAQTQDLRPLFIDYCVDTLEQKLRQK